MLKLIFENSLSDDTLGLNLLILIKKFAEIGQFVFGIPQDKRKFFYKTNKFENKIIFFNKFFLKPDPLLVPLPQIVVCQE